MWWVFLVSLLLVGPAAADMFPDASNAKLPEARKNLDTGLVNVKDYGAVGDTLRLQCAVTTTAASTAVTIAPGSALCAFTAADVGKPIVLWNVGTTATTHLATTISAVTDATHITLGAAPGQTRAASTQYVSWGTDNAVAIAAAYNQAAKMADPVGQAGHVYFPPNVATEAGLAKRKYYGTTAAMGVAPSGYRIATQGAGPYASVVMALGPLDATVGLLYESAGYADGNVLRDIGFDGNMVAANVGYLACSPNSRMDNVAFSMPAPGGINLKVAGNCPAMVATAVRTDSVLNADPLQWPAKHIEINPTDTSWHNILTSGPASQYAIHVVGTANNTAMLSPHTSSAGPVGFQIDATVTYLDDPQMDNGNIATAATGIVVNAPSVKIVGGRIALPSAATIGIQVNASKAGTFIAGFDCDRFTVPANCIQVTYPQGANTQIFANGSSTVVPAYTQLINQAPTGTASLTGVMMGLAGSITPATSGTVEFAAQGQLANSATPNGATAVLRYGTGTAPANGVACTGTGPASISSMTAAINAQKVPFSQKGYAGALTLGTPVWYDLCVLAVTGGTASITNVDIKASEVSRY